MNDNWHFPFSDHQMTRQIGARTVVLESRSLRFGGPSGGLVWNRPLAARVRGPEGETRLPIHDVTRRGQIGLYTLSLGLIIAGLALGRRRP